jgi:hypothetical protein
MADVVIVRTLESLAYAENVGEFYRPPNSSTFCLCSPVKLSNSQLPFWPGCLFQVKSRCLFQAKSRTLFQGKVEVSFPGKVDESFPDKVEECFPCKVEVSFPGSY